MSPFFYSYLITDPKEYGLDIITFKNNLSKVLQRHKVDILCFRDKINKDIEPFAKSALEIAKEFHIEKILINGNIELATQLGFNGVHLTSTQFNDIKKAKEKSLFTFISTHFEDEIELAYKNGADGISYSPIYYKVDKGEPKGCEKLEKIVKKYQKRNFKIFALGGITDDLKIKEVENTNCDGFASISYFTKEL